jgi:lysophospholipase L1-like esterase
MMHNHRPLNGESLTNSTTPFRGRGLSVMRSKSKRFSWLILALLVGLLASLFLNYRLIQRGVYDYAEQQAVRLDPYTLNYFDGEANKTYAHPLVVFYGDSRAAQWVAPNVLGLSFANRGIGNQTTEQVLGRFDAHLYPLKPDVVVLQVGINDLKSIPVLPNQKVQIIARCKANIAELVQRSRALGAKVILTTVFPSAAVPLERRLIWSAEVNAAIIEVNGYIKSLSGEGVIILDAYQLLMNEQGLTRDNFSHDFLHMNRHAYEALNVELTRLLQ